MCKFFKRWKSRRVEMKLTTKLSWELPCNDEQVSQGAHPERGLWSQHLFNVVRGSLPVFKSAKDLNIVVPNHASLTDAQLATKLSELFVQMAKYESSWRPAVTSANVDGSISPDKLGTGFFQLCVVDQPAFKTGTKYTHEELKSPYNNINAGVGIVVHLIHKYGRITFSKGIDHGYFFATLLFGSKFHNVEKILDAVHRLKV
jgi:hypothetical protein